jgi:hypothetical protein
MSRLAPVAVVVLLVATASFAQPDRRSPDILPELLAEVRQLRLAMERSATIAPRVHLLTGRLAMQEQRVARLASELDGIRQQLPRFAEMQRVAGEQIRELEGALALEADPQRRRSFEHDLGMLKRQLEMQAAEEQQLRVREGEVLGLYTQEQGRWLEISNRLDELERSLARP